MKAASWRDHRAVLTAYAVRGAVGAALGALLGLKADLREYHARHLDTTLFAAAVGFLAGLIFCRLQWMRDRGGVYYHFSWGLSVGGGLALYLLPETLRTGEWLAYVVFVAVGITGGFGLGAVFLYMYIKDSESR